MERIVDRSREQWVQLEHAAQEDEAVDPCVCALRDVCGEVGACRAAGDGERRGLQLRDDALDGAKALGDHRADRGLRRQRVVDRCERPSGRRQRRCRHQALRRRQRLPVPAVDEHVQRAAHEGFEHDELLVRVIPVAKQAVGQRAGRGAVVCIAREFGVDRRDATRR